jgi:hypothetical protein
MTKSKAKRNARRSQRNQGFKISKALIVRLDYNAPPTDESDCINLQDAREHPLLFAIARDERTIFASWNIDWRSVFEKATPADRRVHLRVIGRDGVVETNVAIEPMYAMQYVTVSGSQNVYRVEIGYFQGFDTWRCVATSNEIEMPPHRRVELADVDLATIPFHISFHKLADFFGTTSTVSIARAVSQFQKRMLNGDKPNGTTASDRKVLDALNLSLAELAVTERDYKNIDSEELARHTNDLFASGSSSPSRGF